MMAKEHKQNNARNKVSSCTQTVDRIPANVIQWVQNYNKSREKKVVDYGRIHFSENDRTSLFIRFPFVPTNANPIENTERSVYNGVLPNHESYRNIKLLPQLPSITEGTTYAPDPMSTTEPAAQLVTFLRETWEIPLPKMIISITGGARLFKFTNPQLRSSFQKGLVSAAVTTSAWIFTAGAYAGVMKEVGDMFEKWTYKNDKAAFRVPVIGIASWHYTTDCEQLSQYKPEKRCDTRVDVLNVLAQESTSVTRERVADFEKLYRNRLPIKSESRTSWPIDPNHTHFILLDDGLDPNGTHRGKDDHLIRADLTLQLRAEIEQAARKFNKQGQIHKIPIVQLLIEGGPSSVLTVYESVKQRTPVIVIQGTGRAADLIAEACQRSDSNDLDKLISEGVMEKILDDNNKNQFLEIIKSQVYRRLITIFPLDITDSEFELGDKIREVLLTAVTSGDNQPSQIRLEKLRLAMVWNSYNLFAEELLKENKANPWTESQLDSALYEAFDHGSTRLVQLLIDKGASFNRLRRWISVDDLYKKSKMKQPLPLTEKVTRGDYTRRIYYKDYLKKNALKTVQSNEKKCSVHPIKRNLLMSICCTCSCLADINETSRSSNEDDSNCSEHVVFNEDDVILQNGYVECVSTTLFGKLRPFDINLYVMSRMADDGAFHAVHRYKISKSEYSKNLEKRSILLSDSKLYIEAGQLLAIGFGRSLATLKYTVTDQHVYKLFLDEKDSVEKDNQCATLHTDNSKIRFSFRVVPTQDFIRDLFLWSVFSDSYNQSVCLCSHSPNTTTAALLASMIYKTAKESTHGTDKQNEYDAKQERFDAHAAQIIDKCFAQNEEFALQVLETRSDLYFDYSPLELAKATNNHVFLATNCMRAYLDKLWFGDIGHYGSDKFHLSGLIFIVCLCPFLLLFPCIHKIFGMPHPQIGVTSAPKKQQWLLWPSFFQDRAIVKHYYRIIFYVIFLGLFSFVVLVDYFPFNNNDGRRNGFNIGIPVTEMSVHICIWGLIVDEMVEFILHCRQKSGSRHRWYHVVLAYLLEEKWNILDLVTIIVYLIAFITRFIVVEQAFIVSKISICIDLFLWYVRTLQFFAASERLGPKLLMIFNTMKDLTFFVCFILIFLAGYSISSYALITTAAQVTWISNDDNSQSNTYSLTNNGTGLWDWNLFRNVIDWGMWKVYGQVELINHNQVGNTSVVTATNDAYGNTAFVLTICFVCVANVLLLNVLVALFNVTFDRSAKNARNAWSYHRFLLVKEYANKTTLPPPFNIPQRGYQLLRYVFRFCLSKTDNTIGSLYSSSQLDANLSGLIVFNGADCIPGDGTIDTVSINFCKAPISSEAIIELYVIKPIKNNRTLFEAHKHAKPISDLMKCSGVRKFKSQKIPVKKGDYLGFHFTEGAGNPFITSGDSYVAKWPPSSGSSQNTENFQNIMRKQIKFLYYASQGITASFTIKYTRSASNEKIGMFWRPTAVDLQDRSHQTEHSSYQLARLSRRHITLRESSIAQDHWQDELKNIMEAEFGKHIRRKQGVNRGKSSAIRAKT